MDKTPETTAKNFGFVSTRFAGTDGVSLEAQKWAQVLNRQGHDCYWFAGQLDTNPDRSMLVPEAFFDYPENAWINSQVIGRTNRSRACTTRIHNAKEQLKDKLYEFIDRFAIDVIVAQNCLTIPMHVPLGLALAELIVESQIPAIAHHHDFHWERDRFAVNAIPDYLEMAFPPKFMNIQHVVINSQARQQLAHRTGLTSFVIPNVLDFSVAPPDVDAFAASFRKDIGLTDQDLLILQPTRIVPRKGIEHAIELVQRLKDPRCKLVISHDAGDEGLEYQEFLTDYAQAMGVNLRFVSRRVSPLRAEDANLGRRYTLGDAYLHADLVTYPSLYEGFGNAFLEAVYFRKPLLVNRYSIYIRDIEPKGFRVIAMNGYITRAVIEETRRILRDSEYRRQMVDHNFEIARKYYSLEVLQRKLGHLLANIFGLAEI